MGKHVVPFIIDGEEVRPEKVFDVVSPGSGQVVHQCGIATTTEALAAVGAAAKAFPAWRDAPPAKRRDILLRAADIATGRRSELAEYMISEVGASQEWADFNLKTMIEFLKDMAGRAASVGGGMVPVLEDPGSHGMILKEPYGVVLAIAPWNAPYVLGLRSILSPIVAGNTTILKGAEASPRVFWGLVSVLHEAGLPKGVVNLISTDASHAAEVTQTLIAHPAVSKINFTGSTAVGRIVSRLAGENLKPALLELGGKAPAIVWEDADLDLAARECVAGSFLFAGQICMSTERILVHHKVSRAFQEKFTEKIEAIFPRKNEAPILINGNAVEKVKKLLRDAVDKGGAVVAGDVEAREASDTRMRPVVVSGVTPEMDLYRTESFGPSVSIIEVGSVEEALRIANDTEYGLNAAVFTEDLRLGLRLARGIEAGAVHINGMTIHDEAALPHGGTKASGFGRFNSAAGLDEWVRTKTITWKA